MAKFIRYDLATVCFAASVAVWRCRRRSPVVQPVAEISRLLLQTYGQQ
jgi:hypothetical protein